MSTVPPQQDDPAAVNERAEKVFFTILENPPESDPAEHYAWLHANAPVFTTGNGMTVLSRYADVSAALRHRSLGRGKESVQHLTDLPPDVLEPVMARWRRTMVFANPPLHTRMRRAISNAFTPYHVERLRPVIHDHAHALLDALADEPGGNFVSRVSSPLGATLVGELVGVPEADRPLLAKLSPESMRVFDPMTAVAELPMAAAAEMRMAEYFTALMGERMRAPKDDVLSRLTAAHKAGELEDVEVVAACSNLMNAGMDTGVNLMSNGLAILLDHPDQIEVLRRDPGLALRAAEELARLDPPLNLNPRTALADCEVAGVRVAEGQIVISVQGAANRDPSRYTDPDRVDVTRDEGPCLTFGGGIHFCMGAHLGRIMVSELLTCLVTHFSAVKRGGPPERRLGHNIRAFLDLPVTLRR
ncbi:cytochrome P450 [Actinomadura logoneensis]|uniref:cytochrome P450 n=1 Tax=Actinomadura logoneensis TaxID=2293572 RepID=UPI0011C18304|nr:cytochrome P450 [Actinomadura logoneensis]